jgi:hypothetical protein
MAAPKASGVRGVLGGEVQFRDELVNDGIVKALLALSQRLSQDLRVNRSAPARRLGACRHFGGLDRLDKFFSNFEN